MLMRPRSQPRQAIRCNANVNPLPEALQPDQPLQRLRLLSFNMQVGITTSAYQHYLTRCWKHLVSHKERYSNLEKIGFLLNDYDVVALQEADGGSLRTGHINQVKRLAQMARFPYWYQQLNRNLAPFAQHSNGLLSRVPVTHLEDHPLPGPAGRGAILVSVGSGANAVAIVMMHLALSSKARNMQLDYVRELVQDYPHYVLMGDLNTQLDELLYRTPLRHLDLKAAQSAATFPSWRPNRCLDHILLSPELKVSSVEVLPIPISDHLPVATELILPSPLHAQEQDVYGRN